MMAYRIHDQGWSFAKAEKEFRALGGRADDFPFLVNSVRKNRFNFHLFF